MKIDDKLMKKNLKQIKQKHKISRFFMANDNECMESLSRLINQEGNECYSLGNESSKLE